MILQHVWGRKTTSSSKSVPYTVRERVIYASTCLGVSLLAVAAALLLVRCLLVPLLVLLFPSADSYFYDFGVYGVYPERRYHSFNLTSPDPRTPRWQAGVCDQETEHGGLVLLDLHGSGVTSKGPAVLDLRGNLIWTDDRYGQHAMNAKVQEYKGAQYLTFWAGADEKGHYYMLDSGFNLAYNISAVGENVWGDPHEFKITSDGTALILIYNRARVDLSHTHMRYLSKPYIVDAVVQEIDIETGELQFEWHASDHFKRRDGEYLKETYDTHLDPKHAGFYAGELTNPHDYFHMNSVEKDSEGNYLLSIRHTHEVICVSGKTGEILWGFGGKANDIRDLGNEQDGYASDFQWQHDARWIDEQRGILGLFDNGIALDHWYDAPYSRGRIIHLDVKNRTAESLHSYSSLNHVKATSQGSFQFMPRSSGDERPSDLLQYFSADDQVFIGWGSAAAYSLHNAQTEELLCETHYAPSLFWYLEFAKSYRALRAPENWVARPEKWHPNAVVEGSKVHVSWNGGMEVRSWHLQGQHDATKQWTDIVVVPRDGFETTIDLSRTDVNTDSLLYRIAALDADGNVLRYSGTFTLETSHSSLWKILVIVLVVLISFYILTVVLKKRGLRIPDDLLMTESTRGSYRKLEADSEP